MRSLLPLFLLVVGSGCFVTQPEPVRHDQAENNKDYKVDYLFEHEGCKVYRFYDFGNYVYFTNCNGEAIMKTDSTEVRNSIKRSN
jgi:Domain of unknown function (DUF4884)